MRSRAVVVLLLITLTLNRTAQARDIVVLIPQPLRVTDAEAVATKPTRAIDGAITDQAIRFKDVPPDVPHDITLILADESILQGVNMAWYSAEPKKPDAGELNEDDRSQINDVLKKVPAFYNRSDLLLLGGDHDRAVALVQLVRDKAFHSDQGGEVICHVELWYFRNRHGGWEKVQQTDRVLRRERFASSREFHRAVDKLQWIPQLGGLKVRAEQAELRITLLTPPSGAPPRAGAASRASGKGSP